MSKEKIAIFWFRRDLRLQDNVGLFHALQSGLPILPIFIFDTAILKSLPVDDARVGFIYDSLQNIHQTLQVQKSGLKVLNGTPDAVWSILLNEFNVQAVYANKDYEPYAIHRDNAIQKILQQQNIPFHLHKDQVIFEEHEVLKNDGKPYTVFTPYKNKWLEHFQSINLTSVDIDLQSTKFLSMNVDFPSLESIGFKTSTIKVLPYTL